jgi:hypothetical protein
VLGLYIVGKGVSIPWNDTLVILTIFYALNVWTALLALLIPVVDACLPFTVQERVYLLTRRFAETTSQLPGDK